MREPTRDDEKKLHEEVAVAIWHRWGDEDRLTWEEEPEKVAFLDAAAEVITIVRSYT